MSAWRRRKNRAEVRDECLALLAELKVINVAIKDGLDSVAVGLAEVKRRAAVVETGSEPKEQK